MREQGLKLLNKSRKKYINLYSNRYNIQYQSA